jgi:hypothetical protein
MFTVRCEVEPSSRPVSTGGRRYGDCLLLLPPWRACPFDLLARLGVPWHRSPASPLIAAWLPGQLQGRVPAIACSQPPPCRALAPDAAIG